eukprot:CAMPEP_0174817800 /NCGR_PEP_ID=MMETSP1107-20130205/329_1 /TAXON_ID=36770 /ORGANISM="Paraphysomonas vestita, Strain GFlagA" /LENGTH=284 /DNA_ID=CAMNT_0016028827 /DNA_START=214 /DNA_END=1068 /DNA_ORIENTATION=-
MNEILQRHHADEEKQALVKLLDKSENKVNPKEVGILQYLGLDDWRWALPVSTIVGIPLIMQDVIYIDYKMYLVGVFALMWHTYDATLLPIWSEKSDWVGEYIRDAWATFDNLAVEQLESEIKANENFLDADKVYKDIFQAVDEVTVAQATAFNLTNQNEFHRNIQKKLDALASLNEATNVAIRQDMISTVREEAYKTLVNDKKVKEAALAQAIATLAAGANGARGKDVVGEVYIKSIADYRSGLSNKQHKVHQITAKLEAEIAEIVKAPEVIKKAGNVYETHPL